MSGTVASSAATSETQDRQARARCILAALEREYPDAHCELVHRNPLELLVATILSAQCTDERVNRVTPALFARWPDARAFAESEPAELAEAIHSTGFFNAKARHIRAACRVLVDEYKSEMPRTMAELVALPGVGRKTASVVLGVAFGIAEGVVVDTHVFRLSRRMGLADGGSPERVERELMALLPREAWIDWSHLLIRHGRRVCQARKPACDGCVVAGECARMGVA